MKLYAPKYYQKFKCIADKCTHSCCVGWEIDVDGCALEKYNALNGGYGDIIRESISFEDTPHFKLCAGERCVHLDSSGLCRIITNLGEEYLCDICREHPRFYNYTSVAEVGIGMSCPEAARIILDSQDYAQLVEIGEVSAEACDDGFDGRSMRTDIYVILSDRSFSYSARLERIYQGYSVAVGDDELWLDALQSLEYLDTNHKELFMNYSSARRADWCDDVLERFLAYFIYRHCAEAFDEEDFCDRLSFCLFCERLFASLICSERIDSPEEILRLASAISEEIEYSEDNTVALMQI